MPELNRRSFIHALVAAAVATQIPELPVLKSEPLVEKITSQLVAVKINGKNPDWVTVMPAMNGWYRVAAGFKAELNGNYDVDFRGLNDGKGIFIGIDPKKRKYGAQLTTNKKDEYVFSIYVKEGNNADDQNPYGSYS